MNEAAEELQFERAALLRDRLRAVQRLGTRQHVVAGAFSELDAVAFVQGQTRACVCVLHYAGGALQDKEYSLFHVLESDPAEVLASFIKQYYAQRGAAPKTVLLSHEIEEQDAIAEYLVLDRGAQGRAGGAAARRAPRAHPSRGKERARGDRAPRKAVRAAA